MSKIIVRDIEQITPGARHVWLQTNVGRIRKPMGALQDECYDYSQIDKKKIVLIESRLTHWGKWLSKNLTNGLGYPKRSSTERAMEGSHATKKAELPPDIEAEEVDRIIARIWNENKSWALVLRKHYTRTENQTLDKAAEEMELTRRSYLYFLNLGRKKVEFYLKSH